MRKFRSSGTIAEGTEMAIDVFSLAHVAPRSFVRDDAIGAFQLIERSISV